MASKYLKTKFPGVRYYEHKDRKFGIQKDRYYSIIYRLNGKQKEEAIGWASNGATAEKASKILCELKENIRFGRHPQTIAEMRAMNEEKAQQTEIEKEQEQAERITLNELFSKYMEVHKTETAESTWKKTRCYFNLWIRPKLGDKPINDITVEDAQKIIAAVVEKYGDRGYAREIKSTLRKIINFAKRIDLYQKDNPVSKVKIKFRDDRRTRFLTPEEIKILLDTLETRHKTLHDMVLMSLYSGVRFSGIAALQWENINWSADRFTIFDTKNGDNYTLPMHPKVKEMLLSRRRPDSSGHVFLSGEGNVMRQVPHTYARVIEELGFNKNINYNRQKVVFHTLRHTFASRIVMSGVDLYTTQQLMGHKCGAMTQRYAHLAPGHLDKAIQTLK